MRKPGVYILALAVTGAAIGIYCTGGGPSPRPVCPVLVKTYTETALAPGYYCLCWDEIPQTGDSIPFLATHELRITAGTYKTHLHFKIEHDAAHVPSTDCCAASAPSYRPSAPIPDSFSVRVNAPVYAPGDNVTISYALPVTCDVQIEIYALLGCP